MKVVLLALLVAAACDSGRPPAPATQAPPPTGKPASIPDTSVTLLDAYAAGAHQFATLTAKGDCKGSLAGMDTLTENARAILVDTGKLDTLATTDAAAHTWLATVYTAKLSAATDDILTAAKSSTCIADEEWKTRIVALSVAMGAQPRE